MKKLGIFLALVMILGSTPLGFSEPLQVQLEQGIETNELQCNNDSHVLVLRTNGNLACVTEKTSLKTGWEIIQMNFDWDELLNEIPVEWSDESLDDNPGYWVPILEDDREDFAKKFANAIGDSLTGEISKDGHFLTEYGQISKGATTYSSYDLYVEKEDTKIFTEDFMESMGFDYDDSNLQYLDHPSYQKYRYFHEFSSISFKFNYYSYYKINIDFGGWSNNPESIVFPLSEESALEQARTLTMHFYSDGTCESLPNNNPSIKKNIVGGVPFYDISLGACFGELLQGGLMSCDVWSSVNAMNVTDSSFGVRCSDG